ncbi:hypothetical protein V2J09_014917 [Rumex salicifolius]
MENDSNRPKFFYNFIGPESDSMEYVAEAPQTDLSLGVGDGAPAVREVNMLWGMERVWVEQPPPPSTEAQARRRIAIMRRDKHAARRFEAEKRAGYGPNMIPLKRPVERDPTFLLPAPTNPDFMRGAEMGPPPMISFDRGKTLSIGGGGSSAEQREMAANASNKAAAVVVDDHDGSSTSNPNNSKKMKQAVVETTGRPIFPKPMYARGSGSGSGEVIIRGYLNKCSDERIRIVCMCHNYAHTPEEFVNHAGGGSHIGIKEQPCYVTVSRGDGVSCIHAI